MEWFGRGGYKEDGEKRDEVEGKAVGWGVWGGGIKQTNSPLYTTDIATLIRQEATTLMHNF
jgi:hypothetical protein